MSISSRTQRLALHIVSMLSPTQALAGGFDRFDQDISLLFDPAEIVIDISGSYVITNRHYETVNGAGEHVSILENYPNGSIKFKRRISTSVDCLPNIGRPFGSNIDYGINWSGARQIASQKFDVTELAATCSTKARVGAGFLHGVVGISYDSLDFEQQALLEPTTLATSRLTFDDAAASWRAGIAYSMPSIAAVASLTYFSPMDFGFRGAVANVPLGTSVIPTLPIQGDVTIPQGVELSVRGPVAPNWLLGIGAKWVDWSVLDHVPITVGQNLFVPVGTQLLDLKAFFRDGYTVAFYVGHKFDDQWSGMLRLAWDRATETGWTSHSEIWSAQTTIFYKIDKNVEIRASVNFALLEAGEIDEGAIRSTWGDDYAIVPQIGLTSRF